MSSNLFFDPDRLKQGDSYVLQGSIQTQEEHTYDLGDWIGRGGNASVFHCVERATGDEYAFKVQMNTNFKNLIRFRREIELLKSVKADHIIKFKGSGTVTVRHKRDENQRRLPFMIMELADYNLLKLIKGNKPPSFEQYAGQFRGLAEALSSIHEYAIHRDIKPENILVAGEKWLLSDYGLCSFVNKEQKDLTSQEEIMGPKFWLSPEAENRRLGCGDVINTASDVFQLASVFWYVVTGRHPCGIVNEDDWTGPAKLYSLLRRSLLHSFAGRPQNGAEFLVELQDALEG